MQRVWRKDEVNYFFSQPIDILSQNGPPHSSNILIEFHHRDVACQVFSRNSKADDSTASKWLY